MILSNSGKLGSTYENNSKTSGGFKTRDVIDLGSEQSMFCWVKFISLNSDSSLGCGLVSQHRYSKNTGLGLNIKYVSSTTGYVTVSTGTGSSRTYNTYCGSTLLQANTWYHLGFTYDGVSVLKLYVNGACDGTYNIGKMSTPADYVMFYCWSLSGTSGSTVHGNYILNGSMNDARVYDECISPKEIEIISRGLALHYHMDGGGKNQSNLWKGTFDFSGSWNGSGNWTTSTEKYNEFTVKQRTGQWGGINQNVSATNGDKFTISFWAKVDSGGTITSIHRSNLGNVTTGLRILGGNFVSGDTWVTTSTDGTKWKYYWGSLEVTSADITYVQWRIENSVANKTMWICGFKFERGTKPTPWMPHTDDPQYNSMGYSNNVEYDVSGYLRNGSPSGVSYSSDSARYSVSTVFDANTDTVTVPSAFSVSQTMRELSVCIWFKSNTLNGTAPNFFSLGENAFIRARTSNGQSIWCYYRTSTETAAVNMRSYTFSCKNILDNNWHHLVCTFKDGISKCYIDGSIIGTNDNTSDGLYLMCSSTSWHLAGYAANSENFIGSLSDFRLYATALSADAIQELYNMAASITDSGTLMGYEFVEQ